MTGTKQLGYADVHQLYADLGWWPIKLKAGIKYPPPAGWTGADGAYPSAADRHAWADEEPHGNTALRLADGFIGIDEDRYGGKKGQQTIAEAEKRWGELPPIRRSTSRSDGSGICIYRVPPGVKFVTYLGEPETGGVEIIQPHHRYVMAWPSVHPEGRTYEWIDDDGAVTDPPHADDIPELPAAWIEGLRKPEKTTSPTGLGSDGPYNIRQALTEGEPSWRVAGKLGQAVVACTGGSRHDAIRDHVLGLLRCGKQGEPGVLLALKQLKKAFVAAVGPDRPGGAEEASTEFDKFVFSDKVADLLADPSYGDWTRNIGEPPPDQDDTGGEPPEDDIDWREKAIGIELDRMRVRHEARLRLDAETRPQTVLPVVKPLPVLLAEPDPPIRYRIDRLAPEGARIMLSAQFKAGKSTAVANLMRSMVDAEPFLGTFEIPAPATRLVLIDDELSENTLRRWLREQNITNTKAVADVMSLRGKLAAFNLLDDHCHQQWVQRLTDLGCDYLILDCLRPILDALGLDENRDAGRFLAAFDAMLTAAGVGDAFVVQHMGHSGERARGDSRLQDWPDALWRIVRETEEPDSERFFSAYGRDVNVPEGRLTFDPATRRLSYINGSRSDARAEAARADVITLLVDAAGRGAKPNASAIEAELVPPHTQKAIRQAVTALVRAGLVSVDDGPRNSKLHYITNPCAVCRLPVSTGRPRHESCPDSAEEMTFT
ncbi:bifunctional DNA primase/polymerase [Mycobacterium sp. Y57]|uniref:bifunctional DNA primase/polymerase n=1 Tax=Mycolicibacterium xanthum TaxID=2796469 RepID=UPI001C846C62|nr:bifunctional DNA primase/polymerase [Mycolicibacterium xanthum]MBX7431121.1 bifunctional DNA primase/polymerase [Mycolicibacterium xanthum]